jgi:hypothetical protein
MGLNEDEVLLWDIHEKDRLEMEDEARSIQADADAESAMMEG